MKLSKLTSQTSAAIYYIYIYYYVSNIYSSLNNEYLFHFMALQLMTYDDTY